jgi:hypothetical protein
MELEGEVLQRVKHVNEKSRCLFQWWFGFTSNILKQGWISDKQWEKLETFNYDTQLDKEYGCRTSRNKRKYHWTSGLDHDDMVDFTGEDSAMGFYS